MNGLVKSNPKGHFRGKLPSNSASGKSGGKGPFSGSSKDNSFSFKSSNGDRSFSSRERPICLAFNRFPKAYCGLPNNRRPFNRLHKCQTCGRSGCKSRSHLLNRPADPGRPQAHLTNYDPEISRVNGPTSQGQHVPPEPQFQEMFDNFMKTMICSHMEKVEGQPQASSPSHFSGSQPQGELGKPYGMPAITALPSHLSLSNLQLGQKNILWTPITSVDVPLPLPLDTCCSLSLVSKAHADIICQKYPHLQFTKLETPLPVAVATPNSQLKAIGILPVPIVWESGKPCTFSTLVVPQLV